jgi:MFS family permease
MGSVVPDPMNTTTAQAMPEQAEKRAGTGLILAYVLVYFSVFMMALTPVMVSLPIRVRQIAPADYVANLSWILAIGAFLAMLANPFFGRLSDRTTSRWGMRRPWLLAGVLGTIFGCLMMAVVPSVVAVGIGWCLVQVAVNIMQAVTNAILPDQIPPSQRGRVSGFLAMCIAISPTVGALLVRHLMWSPLWMFLTPALIMTIAALVLALVLKDRHLAAEEVEPYSVSQFLQSFWVDWLRYPDFSWIWLSRFLRFLGLAIYLSYQVYFLVDQLGISSTEVSSTMVVSTLIYALTGAVAANLAGWLSDYLKRRKVLLIVGTGVFAAGMALIGLSHTLSTFYAAIVLCGIGHGMFMALDFVIVSEVLPGDGKDAAKNFGVFNIANALPQSLAPALAPLILSIGGEKNYGALFITGALASVGGALVVQFIRKVR